LALPELRVKETLAETVLQVTATPTVLAEGEALVLPALLELQALEVKAGMVL
tara:strand:- start:236 stop:391 length:156 start_codon:yes stop_codon:yes gene_type:complete